MRKLRKSEINRIIKENSALSNEDLLNKYFDIVYHDVLGSQADRMEDVGWNESDVIQVVRCKDCIVPHNQWTGCPILNGLVTSPDFYCSYGERRKEDEEK